MNRHGQKGFTLIEIIIALGILGLVLALVTGSYYGTAMATRRTEERLELISMGRVALDKMILEINGAMVDPKDATTHPFVGENGGGFKDPKDKLNFYTSSFDSKPLGIGSSLAEISYYLEKNPKHETFFLQHRMNPFPNLNLRRGEGGIVNDLAELVLGLGFRYQDDTESWSSRWDSGVDNKLPRLVEITITLQGMGGQTIQMRGMAAPRGWVPSVLYR